MDGELISSSSVKIHWSESFAAILKFGVSSPRNCGCCGGESLESRGGDGTAGGIFAMDLDVGWDRRAFEGASDEKMCGGLYRSTVVMDKAEINIRWRLWGDI